MNPPLQYASEDFLARKFALLLFCRKFAVPTKRDNIVLRRAAVKGSNIFGHFLCPYIERLRLSYPSIFALQRQVLFSLATGYGSRFFYNCL